MKYAGINEHRDSFPIAVPCDVLEVSTSGDYESLTRTPGPRAERHQRIQQAVQQVHADSHGAYGSIKIAKVLRERDDLESACRNTVATTMQELGLASCVSKAFRPTTTQADPAKQPAENTLDQDFTAQEPNRKWVVGLAAARVPRARSRRLRQTRFPPASTELTPSARFHRLP